MTHFKLIALLIILVLIPTESKAQWELLASAPSAFIKDISISDGEICLGLLNDGIYKSSDSAATWQQINNGLNSEQARSVYQLLIFDGDIYAATVDGIYKSSSGGDNWVKKSAGITIGPGAIYEFTASVFEHNGVLLTGAWNGIYRSMNNGENWEITNISGQGIFPGFFINHNGTLFLARENINNPYGYLSADHGETWEPLTTIPVPTITFLSEPNRLWSGTINGIWLSTDNGASWIHRSDGLPLDPYNSSIIRVNGKLISSIKFGGSGVFYSEDEGENWTNFSEGLPFLSSIEKLIVYGDRIFAATSDGLWGRDTSDVTTGLAHNQDIVPRTFQASQNYPNPFNARTIIEFSMSQMSVVAIEVYDLRGRKLETIFEAALPPGGHSVTWKAEDYPTGVYFYRIQAGDYAETRKMALLK